MFVVKSVHIEINGQVMNPSANVIAGCFTMWWTVIAQGRPFYRR